MYISKINTISFGNEIQKVQEKVQEIKDDRNEFVYGAAGGVAGAAALQGRRAISGFKNVAKAPKAFQSVAKTTQKAYSVAGDAVDVVKRMPKNKAKIITNIIAWAKGLKNTKLLRPIARLAETKAFKGLAGAVGGVTSAAICITGIATMANTAAKALDKKD